jgi:hypothetical protein
MGKHRLTCANVTAIPIGFPLAAVPKWPMIARKLGIG